jgi:hypothetical protein
MVGKVVEAERVAGKDCTGKLNRSWGEKEIIRKQRAVISERKWVVTTLESRFCKF